MFDELDFFLSQHTDDYRKAILLEAMQNAFEVLGTPILDKVNDLIFSSGDLSSDVAVQQIVDFARVNIVASAAEFGVVLNPDTILDENLPIFTDIIETLLIVDQYEDPHRIIALLEDADDTEESLAALVEEVTGQAAFNVLDVLGAVDRDLIQRIMEENGGHIASMEAKAPTDNSIDISRAAVDRLKHSEHFNREGFVETNLVVARLFGSEPFVILESLGDAVYDQRDQELAVTCYQIACASNVLTNAVIGTAKNLVERVLTEDQAQERQKVAFMLNRFPVPSVEL